MDYFIIFVFVLLILFFTNLFKSLIKYFIEDYNIFFPYKKETTYREETIIEQNKFYVLPYLLFVLYFGYFYFSYNFLTISFISKNDYYSSFVLFIWFIAFAYNMFSFKEKHIGKPLVWSSIAFGCYFMIMIIRIKNGNL